VAGLEKLNQIRAVCFGTQLAVDFVDLASFIDVDNRSITFPDYRDSGDKGFRCVSELD
jgi:hypothetical protein